MAGARTVGSDVGLVRSNHAPKCRGNFGRLSGAGGKRVVGGALKLNSRGHLAQWSFVPGQRKMLSFGDGPMCAARSCSPRYPSPLAAGGGRLWRSKATYTREARRATDNAPQSERGGQTFGGSWRGMAAALGVGSRP